MNFDLHADSDRKRGWLEAWFWHQVVPVTGWQNCTIVADDRVSKESIKSAKRQTMSYKIDSSTGDLSSFITQY